MPTNARALAFYLPQYFPIPENDAWWGPGFTEWTNVAKARPLFPGHRQPTLPSELGFYDLRVPETRAAQAALAQAYGVEGFVYWHYWFGHGDRILDRPFREVRDSGEPDLPFCLAWANQSWTGIWHGAQDRVLKQQHYPGVEDDQAHFDELLPAFTDPRYLTVDGRPIFYVFRPEELPDAAGFVERWQGMARSAGLPGLYLVAEMSDLLGRGVKYASALQDGFDTGVYMRLPAEITPRAVLRMRALRKTMRGGPEIYTYSDSVMAQAQTGSGHPALRLPELGQHPAVGSRGPGPRRGHAREVPAQRRRRGRDHPRPSGAGAAALGQVVERVGRGQPPRTRREGRPGLARGPAGRDGARVADGAERRLRIAMISYYLPSGSKIGVGYQVHELATELVRRGHEVDVFSDCPPVEGAVYGHHHVHLSGSMRTFRFATELRKVDLSGYDVLHAHGDDYWLWRRRVPVHVRTIHGSCFEEALTIRGAKEKARMVALGLTEVLASLVADTTVVVSPATRRWLPWVRTVVPNGVDTSRFYPDESQRSAHPTVLFVGTWGGRKRGAALAEAFQRDVLPEVPGAELRMVTQDAPADPGAGITVLGRLDDGELAREYRAAWVFCLPSSYEGFGIPYAEAMASGTPVVATPNPGARYVLDDGRAGELAELDHLGPVLARILGDPRTRHGMRAAGRQRSRSFSLATVVEAYESLYRGGCS